MHQFISVSGSVSIFFKPEAVVSFMFFYQNLNNKNNIFHFFILWILFLSNSISVIDFRFYNSNSRHCH